MILHQTKFTVIIPLNHNMDSVKTAIESILVQTHTAAEIIVVSDNRDSGDELVNHYDCGRLRIINVKQATESSSKNTAIKAARSPYICFLEAGNSWEPHYLQEISKLIRQFPAADVYTTSYQYKYSETDYKDPRVRWTKGRPKGPSLLSNFFAIAAAGELPFTLSCFAARRSAFNRIGYLPEWEAANQTDSLFANAALDCKLAYSPRVLCFIQGSDSQQASLKKSDLAVNNQLLFRIGEKTTAAATSNTELRAQLISYAASHIMHIAALNMQVGKIEEARLLLTDNRCIIKPLTSLWWKHMALKTRIRLETKSASSQH